MDDKTFINMVANNLVEVSLLLDKLHIQGALDAKRYVLAVDTVNNLVAEARKQAAKPIETAESSESN